MDENIFFRIECYDIVIEENKMWFFCAKKNILCEFDRLKNQVFILAEMDETELKAPSYCLIKKIGMKLILIPWMASKIAVFDLNTKQMRYIPLDFIADMDTAICNNMRKFWKSFVYKNYVYMLGFEYPAIIKLDINTMQLEYLTDCFSVIGKNRNGYFIDYEIVGTDVWISCGSNNLMIKFKLLNDTFEYYSIPVSVSGLGAFAYDGEFFWISEWKYNYEKLIRWSPDEKRAEEIIIRTNSKQKIWCQIHSVVDAENKVLLFPFSGSTIYQVDKKKKVPSVFSKLKTYYKENSDMQQTYTLIKKDRNTVLWVGDDLILHEYNLETDTCTDYEVKLDDSKTDIRDFLQNYVNNILVQNNLLINEGTIPIKYFLNSHIGNKKDMEQTSVGKAVFEFLNS